MEEKIVNIQALPNFVLIPIHKIQPNESFIEQCHLTEKENINEFHKKEYDNIIEQDHFFIQRCGLFINVYSLNVRFLFSHKFNCSYRFIDIIL